MASKACLCVGAIVAVATLSGASGHRVRLPERSRETKSIAALLSTRGLAAFNPGMLGAGLHPMKKSMPEPKVNLRNGNLLTMALYNPEDVREYDDAEEKALREVRIAFGGYPAGKYFTLQNTEGMAAAYKTVREDYPVLSKWSDVQIKATVASLKSTPYELITETPIGPFLVFSSFFIYKDGLDAWGIPPHPIELPFR